MATPYVVAQIDALLPEIVDRNVENLFPLSAQFITMFEDKTDTKTTNHRGRYIPYIDKFPASFGSVSPAGTSDLTSTSSMEDSRILVTTQHLECGIEIDYDSWVNNENGQPIIDAVTRNVTLQMKFFNQMRDIYASRGNGTSALATVSASASSTTITCNGASDFIGTTNLFANMEIDVYDATLVTKRNTDPLKISAVSGTAITTTASVTGMGIVDTDIVIPTGLTTSLAGVPYHVAATGAYFDKSNRALTKGLVSSILAAGGAISPALMIKLKMYVSRRSDTPAINASHAWFLSTTVYPSYRNIAYTNSRFLWDSGGVPTTDLGQKGRSKKTMDDLSFDGTPMYVMKFWVPDRMDLLDISDFEHHVLKSFGPIMMPTGEWTAGFNGTTSRYQHRVAKWYDSFEQTFCRAPFRQGALTGITVSGSETATPKAIGM